MWPGIPIPPRRNDRHLWKHYLPPTWLAGGKYGSLNLGGHSGPIDCKSNQVTMGQRSSANDMPVNMLLYHSVFGGRVKMELLVFYDWKISKHIVTARTRFLGQGNVLHLFVILFTGGPCQGDPPGQRPPWTETPRTKTPPCTVTSGRILLECILVNIFSVFYPASD